jgi:signal transduction histidine kinase
MIRRSLRVRIALAIALTGLILSAGTSLAVYALTAGDLTDNARANERARVELAAALFQRTGEVVVGAVKDDAQAPRLLRRAVAGGLLGTYRTPSSIWAGTPLPGGHGIYVVDSTDANRGTLAALRTTLIVVSVLATLLAAALGMVLAARLVAALMAAAGVADRIAGGDLAARVGASGEDEVARLGLAIDQMAAALVGRIDRERRFAADVAHELRTPLTSLVTASELLDESRPAQIVRGQVGALRRLVEDLLEIFRLEGGSETVERAPVDLGRFAAGVLAAKGLDGELDVRGSRTVETDQRRLERVLANLLDNAVRHGAPPIHVEVDGARITVADAGPGFPAELLSDGPAPFRVYASARDAGSGLGLAIALAQASLLGATLDFANRPQGGAAATLDLEPPPDLIAPPR